MLKIYVLFWIQSAIRVHRITSALGKEKPSEEYSIKFCLKKWVIMSSVGAMSGKAFLKAITICTEDTSLKVSVGNSK